MTKTPPTIDLLILGAGWTSTFLLPLLNQESISFVATSTAGRDGTLPFRFDSDTDDASPFAVLPPAHTILITFPLKGAGPSERLVAAYAATHPSTPNPQYLQLGSTGIWTAAGWTDRHSEPDTSNARFVAEEELLSVAPTAAIFNLAGLYGGARQPRAWVSRVAKTEADAKAKGALHLIHGEDVSRAIVAAHRNWDAVKGQRWLVSDTRVYDWWWLMAEWDAGVAGKESGLRARVAEWMGEEGVRALPRESEKLGRCLDARETWKALGIVPMRTAKDVLG